MSEWISVKERLPESDDLVLALVDGKPTENVTLVGAHERAVYDPEEKEWILEMWPEWSGAKVTYWMPLSPSPEEGLTMAEYIYQKSIDCALRHITVARDNFAHHHAEQFDIDWAMEQFNHALDILERLRGYAPPEWEG